jgi:hypothetical protein
MVEPELHRSSALRDAILDWLTDQPQAAESARSFEGPFMNGICGDSGLCNGRWLGEQVSTPPFRSAQLCPRGASFWGPPTYCHIV